MSKVILPPYRLQQGTTFEDSKFTINDNFESLATAFNGFAVTAQPPFDFGVGGTILAAGMDLAILPLFANDADDTPLVAQPKTSLYIDAPLGADGFPSLDPNYLFPTGSNITGDRLAMMMSVFCQITPPTADDLLFWTFEEDGVTYYPVANMVIVVRNAGALSHDYFIRVDGSVYTARTSQFR